MSHSKHRITYKRARYLYFPAYAIKFIDKKGSAITNGREPRSCLGRVFNCKLGSFTDDLKNVAACKWPVLKLKIQPRFLPVSWSLSMDEMNLNEMSVDHWACCQSPLRLFYKSVDKRIVDKMFVDKMACYPLSWACAINHRQINLRQNVGRPLGMLPPIDVPAL